MSTPDRPVNLNTTLAPAPGHIATELAGEVVIMHMERGLYYGLDAVGARVWELIQEPRTLAAIRDALMAEYDVDAERCEQDLIALVEQLAAEGLIEVNNAPDTVASAPTLG